MTSRDNGNRPGYEWPGRFVCVFRLGVWRYSPEVGRKKLLVEVAGVPAPGAARISRPG